MSVSTLEESLFTTRYRVYTAVNEPVPHRAPTTVAYTRRWCVLANFAGLCLMQGFMWSSWWYLPEVTSLVFDWTPAFHAGLHFTSVGMFVLLSPPMWHLVGRFGRSGCTKFVSLLLTVMAGGRCVPSSATAASVVSVLTAATAGVVACITFTAPAAISATWFPSHQRTVATAWTTLSGAHLALATSYFFPAVMLPSNVTQISGNDTQGLVRSVDRVLTVEFLFCLVVSVCLLAFFPESPPLPPSSVADLPRIDVRKSVSVCLRSRNFWLTMLARGIPLSSQLSFLGILQGVLDELGIIPHRLGLLCCLAGLACGILCSVLADLCWRRLKSLICAVTAGAAIMSLLASLTTFSLLSDDEDLNARLFTGFLVSAAALSAATSVLLVEFACELTYPAHEMVTIGVQTVGFGVLWSIVYAIHLAANIGSQWVLPSLTVASTVSLLLTLLVRAEYRRQAIDLEDERDILLYSSAT